jgi:hypothetical protein
VSSPLGDWLRSRRAEPPEVADDSAVNIWHLIDELREQRVAQNDMHWVPGSEAELERLALQRRRRAGLPSRP